MLVASPRDLLAARMCCLESVLELAFYCCFFPSFSGAHSTRTIHSNHFVRPRHVNKIDTALLGKFEAAVDVVLQIAITLFRI